MDINVVENKKEKIGQALMAYRRRFRKHFPLAFFLKGEKTTDEELQKVVDEINSCLKAGKRYDISKLNIKTYTKDEVEEAVKMYEDVFEEGFPLFMAPDSDEGIIEIINKAFKTGKKYSPRIQRQKDGTPVVY